MKLWRKRAEIANIEETIRQQNNGDLAPGKRIRHQGKKNKINFTECAKVPSQLFQALMNRV